MPYPPEIIHQVVQEFLGEDHNAAALAPLSMSCRDINRQLRGHQFRVATITTYVDILKYQRMANEVPSLLEHFKVLRVIRLENTVGHGPDAHFRTGALPLPFNSPGTEDIPRAG